MAKVDKWLEGIGLERYVELFAQNHIDLDVLPDLSETDLAQLGIPVGDRKRLAKRGLCPVGVAIAHERAPKIDLGLRCGRLTFRDPSIDICSVERISAGLGGLRQPGQSRGIEIGASARRLG